MTTLVYNSCHKMQNLFSEHLCCKAWTLTAVENFFGMKNSFKETVLRVVEIYSCLTSCSWRMNERRGSVCSGK